MYKSTSFSAFLYFFSLIIVEVVQILIYSAISEHSYVKKIYSALLRIESFIASRLNIPAFIVNHF